MNLLHSIVAIDLKLIEFILWMMKSVTDSHSMWDWFSSTFSYSFIALLFLYDFFVVLFHLNFLSLFSLLIRFSLFSFNFLFRISFLYFYFVFHLFFSSFQFGDTFLLFFHCFQLMFFFSVRSFTCENNLRVALTQHFETENVLKCILLENLFSLVIHSTEHSNNSTMTRHTHTTSSQIFRFARKSEE